MATDFTSYVYGCDYQAGSQYQSLKTCANASFTLTGGYRYNSNNWVMMFKFTMPANASSITLSLCTIAGANGGAQSTMKYKFFTSQQSSPNYTSSTSADGTVTIKNGSSITRNNLTFTRSFKQGTTYYLYFWTANSTSDTTNLMRVRWYANSDGYGCYATYEPVTSRKLYTHCGTGASLTVNRTSSDFASTGNITHDADIYKNDKLKITYSITDSAYQFTSCTVADVAFTSGDTYTVDGTRNVPVSINTELKTYTVSYDANGGSGAPSTQTKTHGVDLTLSSTKPTKASVVTDSTGTITISYNANGGSSTPSTGTGTYTNTNTQPYSFSTWNTKSNGSGTSYSSGGKYTANSSTTLYAQYTAGTITTVRKTNPSIKTAAAISRANDTITGYKVSFNLNGGSNVTPNTITSTKTRKYTFSKWKNLNSGTEFSASTSYTFSVSATLTAQWIASDSNNAITLPTPTRLGYKFLGWAESATASSGVTGSYTPKKDLTLYAIWEVLGSVKIKTEDGIHSYVPFIYTKSKWTRAVPFVYKQDKGWNRAGGD